MTTRLKPRRRAPAQELQLVSPAFQDGGRIPELHTREGRNLSPALRWSRPPRGTRSLALICEDPDAGGPDPFVHWLLADLDPDGELPEGAHPPGAVEGRNSFGRLGYDGPHPPRGGGVHHYHFRLLALDAPLRLTEGYSREDLLRAIDGDVLAEGVLVGTCVR